jgi:hypothetical protein
MKPKKKLLFEGKVFHLIEGVQFASGPIFASGNDRIMLNSYGKVIHRTTRTEEDIFWNKTRIQRSKNKPK